LKLIDEQHLQLSSRIADHPELDISEKEFVFSQIDKTNSSATKNWKSFG